MSSVLHMMMFAAATICGLPSWIDGPNIDEYHEKNIIICERMEGIDKTLESCVTWEEEIVHAIFIIRPLAFSRIYLATVLQCWPS